MKINKTYRSLLDKSINSMLSAIEIYNKPDFHYREETFAILAVNSWELLFKAQLLKQSKYNMNSLYEMEFVKKKNGENSTRTKPKTNRVGNPITISLFEAVKRLDKLGKKVNPNLINSIEAIIELRDNAIHFYNEKSISKELQELGFACIKNYMSIVKNWDLEIDLTKYNFYLMPLAYVDSKVSAESVITDEIAKYLDFVKLKVNESDNDDVEYDVAIAIDIQFKKSNTFEDGLPIKYDANGLAIALSEEDIRKKFPFDYKDITDTASSRYTNFSRNMSFHYHMKTIKANDKLCYTRKLDPKSKTSQKKDFYSSNIWQVLDKHYQKF